MKKSFFIVLLSSALLQGCGSDTKTLFTDLDKSDTGIDFRNLVIDDENLNISHYIYLYNGAGVAIGDINNDGLQDIFFSGNMVKNRLYLNKGNFEFDNITEQSHVAESQGWCTGTSMVDINQDGLLDIYVCRSADENADKRKNLLFINNGDLSFTESAEQYGLADNGYSTHASFFDYDKDGDLDCFVLNHSLAKYSTGVAEKPELRKVKNPDFADRLYRNDKGHFVDVSEQAGIVSNVLNFGLGIVTSDFNDDGWPDIFVSNDFEEPDYFYLNNKDGTFTESLGKCLKLTSLFTMGADAADYNNDGFTDLLTLDMLPESNYLLKTHAGANNFDKTNLLIGNGFQPQFSQNMLQRNNGDGTFSEVGQIAGVSNTDWSWSALFCDFDGDTNKDLFVSNGFVKDFSDHDFINFSADKLAKGQRGTKGEPIQKLLAQIPTLKIPNYVFRNTGDGSFTNATTEWGVGEPILSYGAAYADLDNDGDMDLVVSNTNDYATMYRNNTRATLKPNYLQVALEGTAQNRNGIGTKVKLFVKGQVLYQEQFPVRGYQSSMDMRLTFGLGQATAIDSLVVIWPNDQYQVLKNLPVNQSVLLKAADAKSVYNYSKPAIRPIFTQVDTTSIRHTENAFNDFTVQRLLPNYLSREGPPLALADINNDGFRDLFMGNSKGSPSALYLQSANGLLKPVATSAVSRDATGEVTSAEFFDADGDRDMDLYVAHGGYEYEPNDPQYQDEFFMNDGKGNFSQKTLPPLLFSKGCVRAGDMDGDGDADLFVGGRLIPGNYPLPAPSRLLVNDGSGNFTDNTKSLAPIFDTLGMVTDAAWVDLDHDKKKELVIVGEWMPVKVFAYVNNTLADVSAQYINFPSNGWWNRISLADLDKDGDEDLVLGNVGLNTQFHVSAQQPITELYKDFDNNGSIDPILFYYIQGTSYPAFSRDEMSDQLPGIKKKFLLHKDYAKARLNDIFTPEELAGSKMLKAEFMETIFLENTGKEMKLHHLPAEANYAPVYGIVAADFNGDQKIDLLLTGNNTWTRVRFGRYTSNHGILLTGDGAGNFRYQPQTISGLNLSGNIRSAALLNDNQVLLGVNDGNAIRLTFNK